jgi:citrate lyase beta subunit
MTLPHALSPALLDAIDARLGHPNEGLVPEPHPVHVVYGGAHLYSRATLNKLGSLARAALDTAETERGAFLSALGLRDVSLGDELLARLRRKLEERPIESLCIDFEDGFGPRSNDEEDREATRAAVELAHTEDPKPLIGIRIKALSGVTVRRALRTLDLFLTTLARETSGRGRAGFSVTLPKVTDPAQVEGLAMALEHVERVLGLPERVAIELMVETPGSLLDGHGLPLFDFIAAGAGRVRTLHLGAYDLTAGLGVTAADQRLDHPYCDLARMLLVFATVGTTVTVSDGATTLLPTAPKGLSGNEAAAAMMNAWTLHARNVTRAIDVGIFRGWDLHPAQLPARYGALYAYFLERRSELSARLQRFMSNATQATRVGQAFDDAATGQGLMLFFRRGLECGALNDADLNATTLRRHELTMSFADILAARALD